MTKRVKGYFGFALLLAALMLFAACAKSNGEVIYDLDVLPPPEVELPANTATFPVLPSAPAEAPVPIVGNAPSVASWRAASKAYSLEEKLNGDVEVSFDDETAALTDWSYVYVEIADYTAAYTNIKLKIESNGAESVTVQAVYYEQYALGYPAVTLLVKSLVDGDNLLAASFSDTLIQNAVCNPVSGKYLKNQTILGFMIFIDSNPTMERTDLSGSLTVTAFGVVDDSDPDLEILKMAPRIVKYSAVGLNGTPIMSDSQNVQKAKDLSFDYTAPAGGWGYIGADIEGYKSEYTGVRFKLKATGTLNLSIGILYKQGSSSQKYNWFDGAYMTKPTSGVEEQYEFDFTYLEELDEDYIHTVPGSYIRFLQPAQLLFYVDNALDESNNGLIEIKDVEFFTQSTEGAPTVMGNWMVGATGIEKSNVNPGGYATLTYDTAQGWSNATVGVSGYKEAYCVLEIKVKFYGSKNLGVALAYGGGNTVIMQSHWGGNPIENVTKTVLTETGNDSLGDYTQYTITLDFEALYTTGATPVKLTSCAITAVYFYIDAVDESGNELKGALGETRIMMFTGVEFKTK